jgi:hypothetical protein
MNQIKSLRNMTRKYPLPKQKQWVSVGGKNKKRVKLETVG